MRKIAIISLLWLFLFVSIQLISFEWSKNTEGISCIALAGVECPEVGRKFGWPLSYLTYQTTTESGLISNIEIPNCSEPGPLMQPPYPEPCTFNVNSFIFDVVLVFLFALLGYGLAQRFKGRVM